MTVDGSLVVAIYAAVVSSALAILRILDFRQSRERLHFNVYAAEVLSEDPAAQGKPRPQIVTIAIGNRAPLPIHVTSIAFILRSGTGLMQLNPPLGTPKLPQRLEPSQGFNWVLLPDKLRESLGDRDVDEIRTVLAYDGSGWKYEREITRWEREHLREVVGPQLTTWRQRLGAWVHRRWWSRPRRGRAQPDSSG